MSRGVKAQDLAVGDTVHLIFGHLRPLEYKIVKGIPAWVIPSHTPAIHKDIHVTQLVARVSFNDVLNLTLSIYGGPQAGAGLGLQFRGRAPNFLASGDIPYNLISRGWLLDFVDATRATDKLEPWKSTRKTPIVFAGV